MIYETFNKHFLLCSPVTSAWAGTIYRRRFEKKITAIYVCSDVTKDIL